MTPNDIEVMLHFHYSSEPHPREDSRAVVEATERFVSEGLLKEIRYTGPNTVSVRWEITLKGKVWVSMLCETPFPVQKFVDPREFK